MKKFTLSLLVAFLAGIQLLSAQDVHVTGRVTDASGNALPGVTVVVPGTARGVNTLSDGSYSISVPGNATLHFSFVGMTEQEIPVNNRTVINVVMEYSTLAIGEVIVTGYGSQRRASFTGAASVVGEEALSKRTEANFVKSLEGSIPGLIMNNSTSMPGVWGSVNIRGRGSLNSGTQPLYVIDGMPINSDTDSMWDENNAFDPMASINAADIESVTVLKDAAATAIYGSRAANGVIVITTKKGIQGNFMINFETKQGFSQIGNNNMDFADAWQTADLFAKGIVARYPDDYTYDSAYAFIVNRYEWDEASSYDWMDAISRNAYFQEYNLNVSGRSQQTGFYVSMGYLNTDGIIIGSDLERYTGRVNVDSKFKAVTFGANLSYSYSIRNGFSQSTGGSLNSPVVGAISGMLPFYPFYNEDGSYTNRNASVPNPLAVMDERLGDLNEVRNQTVNLSPYLQVDFGKGIYGKTTLGVNLGDQRQYTYWSAIYNPQGQDTNGRGFQYNSLNTVITLTNLLGWNYVFDNKHTVGLMLGQEMQRKEYNYQYLDGTDFPFASIGLRLLTTAGNWLDSESWKSQARLASYFFDGNYAYDDKYYVSASFRRDGSSVFGANNRWGNFWSVGGRWRVTGEDFLANNKTFTNVALRASYGTVGNQDIGWYASRGFYSSTGYNYNSVAGMIRVSEPIPNVTWETSKKFNVGVDLSFLNRYHLSVDFYNETTEDTLFELPLSRTTGLSSITQNIGSIRNRGVEAAINAVFLQGRDLTWSGYFNVTYNQNRVLELSTDEPIEGTYTIVEEGRPYRQFYMKEYVGVNRETGEPLWYLNAEGDETTSNYNLATKRYVGSADPKLIGGFGTTLTWKGVDFSATFNYRLGGKVLDTGANYTGWGMNSFWQPLEDVALNSWTEDNMDAKYPQYIYGDPYQVSTGLSSRFLYSGNFLRISNLTLGYTLPSHWLQKVYIQRLRAYVTVDNLYTFTSSDFTGFNPETFSSGIIAWQYPSSRTFTAGVQITF